MMKQPELPYKPYVLIDTRDRLRLRIFYAGITQQPLHTRRTQHIHEALAGKGGRKKMLAIQEMVKAKKRPLILGIGTVTPGTWQEAEKELIRFLKKNNVKLTNRSFGGAGQTGLRHTEAEKRKIAAGVSRARAKT